MTAYLQEGSLEQQSKQMKYVYNYHLKFKKSCVYDIKTAHNQTIIKWRMLQ